MTVLFIDTSDYDQTSIYLISKDFLKLHVWKSKRTQAESLHSEIKKFLKKSKINISEIDKLAVVVGPGQFSRVRTGVVTANTLAYALKIPVIGIKKLGTGVNFNALLKDKGQKTVEVFYDRTPNITMKKSGK